MFHAGDIVYELGIIPVGLEARFRSDDGNWKWSAVELDLPYQDVIVDEKDLTREEVE